MREFNDVLCSLDFNPDEVRLLRHRKDFLKEWDRGGPTVLGCCASFQKRKRSPYSRNGHCVPFSAR